jgi:hypothetical protein
MFVQYYTAREDETTENGVTSKKKLKVSLPADLDGIVGGEEFEAFRTPSDHAIYAKAADGGIVLYMHEAKDESAANTPFYKKLFSRRSAETEETLGVSLSNLLNSASTNNLHMEARDVKDEQFKTAYASNSFDSLREAYKADPKAQTQTGEATEEQQTAEKEQPLLPR